MQQALEVPGLVSLAAGLVDQDTLPTEPVLGLCSEIFGDATTGRAALQYGTTEGLPPLRELASARWLETGPYGQSNCLVTTGSQQFLELIGEACFDPGDIVIVEDPTYFVYLGGLDSFGVELRTVASDGEGLVVEDLHRLLTELEQTGEITRLKAIYVQGYHQNPAGTTLSLDRRQQLIATFDRLPEQVLVIEDAAYVELGFDGSAPPLMANLVPDSSRMATALTFSKPFAPGLKCGIGVVSDWLYEPVHQLKGNHDFGGSNLTQAILGRALASGAFDEQVDRLRERYRQKAGVLHEALATHLPAGVASWTEPRGGLYLWMALDGIPTGPDSEFFAACIEERVLYVPGAYAFAADATRQAPDNFLRLTYGVASLEDLEEGARRLGRAIQRVSGG
jgi:2-aminoadipate transaminase